MRILIIGGGIAGFAAAGFLRQKNIDCTVIERAESFRAGGHFIAVKPEGERLLERLGVRVAITEQARDLTYFRPSGHVLRRSPVKRFDEAFGGLFAIRRSELSQALYDAIKDTTPVRFGTQATSIEQDPKGVTVTSSDGSRERYDVVIGADGLHSATRERLFGSAGEWPLGGSYVALEVNCPHEIPVGAMHVYLGRGRVIACMATDPRRVAAIVYHGGDDLRPRLTSPAAARDFFAREYASFDAPVRAMLSAIDDANDIFVDIIAQVKLPNIVVHRVALLGDAATCPSLLSGMGSTAAILAAETLATALATEPNVRAALTSYERTTQEHAKSLRESVEEARRFLLGSNPFVTVVRNTTLALTASAMSGAALGRR